MLDSWLPVIVITVVGSLFILWAWVYEESYKQYLESERRKRELEKSNEMREKIMKR